MKNLLFFTGVAFLGCLSCRQAPDQSANVTPARVAGEQAVYKVLPLGPIDSQSIRLSMAALEKYAGKVILLPAENLPQHAYYAPRNRYRADSLIRWMTARAAQGEVYVGITKKDISTQKNGHPDFGVMGLAYQPGRACIVSSFRVKNKKQVFKVALHEAAHTAGLPHCPEKTCFVRDARGGDPTGEETGFCIKCSLFLKRKGWLLGDKQRSL